MRSALTQIRALIFVVIITKVTIFEGSAYGKEPIVLDNFIGRIENRCELSSDLQSFRSDLFVRYFFERSNDQPHHNIRIPLNIRPSIGHALAIYRKSHTEITVPLKGLYHGLETRSLIFTIGHGNGIAATIIVFKSDTQTVESALKDSVTATKSYLENDPEGKQMMIEVDLESRPEGMALICDQST